MSDEVEAPSPAPNPAPPESPLLEPEKKGMGGLIVPGLIGVAGAALLYSSISKKKDKKSAAKKPVAEVGEVKFSKNFATYSIGKDWKEMVLEPFLADQAEENNLITSDYQELMEGMTMEQLRPVMAESREGILKLFRSTHKVETADGLALISTLPADKSGVQAFNKWLDSETETFQENY